MLKKRIIVRFFALIFSAVLLSQECFLQVPAQWEVKEVKQLFVHEENELVHLVINGEKIDTTINHPFFVDNLGFISAKDLQVRDELRLYDGSTATVESVEIEDFEEPVLVYNFEVEEFHTYFVGEQSFLVHNDCTVHGNSKTSTKPQHGYEIYNKETGDVVKTGISGQAINKNGTSPRANSQVNRLNKGIGSDVYDARIVITNIPDRASALEWKKVILLDSKWKEIQCLFINARDLRRIR